MKALTVLTIMVFLIVGCDKAIFSSSNSKTGGDGGPVFLVEEPVVPVFGDVITCNPDFDNVSNETIAQVGCVTGAGDSGLYICKIPLDGIGQVETLCLTPDDAATEVTASCDCTDDGGGHDDDSSSSDDDSSSSDDDKYSSSTFRFGGYKHRGNHRHGGSCNSNDDDSSSSDDDGIPGVCVPSTTLQYRLGNCADLF